MELFYLRFVFLSFPCVIVLGLFVNALLYATSTCKILAFHAHTYY